MLQLVLEQFGAKTHSPVYTERTDEQCMPCSISANMFDLIGFAHPAAALVQTVSTVCVCLCMC
jgi:hypothetical protein